MTVSPPPPPPEDTGDLGLGRVLSNESATRFLDKDGRFVSRRLGLPFWRSISPYHELLRMSWGWFFAVLAGSYLVLNAVFALLYGWCGPGALDGTAHMDDARRFEENFFFSVQTLATIGYGHVAPLSFSANVVATVEAFVGLLGVALATGLLFARFSRPTVRILFSGPAVVAPFGGGRAWMFRMVNGHRTQIVDVEAEVTLSRFETEGGVRRRRFHALELERRRVAFFPLGWTVVHPITPRTRSPLWGLDDAALRASEAEFLVQVRGTDDTLYQPIHARTSYRAEETVWNARFGDMYRHDAAGTRAGRAVAIDVRRLSDVRPVVDEPPLGG